MVGGFVVWLWWVVGVGFGLLFAFIVLVVAALFVVDLL